MTELEADAAQHMLRAMRNACAAVEEITAALHLINSARLRPRPQPYRNGNGGRHGHTDTRGCPCTSTGDIDNPPGE